jgi:hypothetical protein
MATILEQLRELADADGQKYIDYLISTKPDLTTHAVEQDAIYSIYANTTVPEPVVTPTTPVTPVTNTTTPTVPAVTAAPVTHTPTVPNSTSTPSIDVAKLLADMSAKIDKSLADLDSRYVTAAKLPEYRTEMTGIAIKAADDYATVRENHRAEFGEPINRNEFEKFVTDQTTAGAKFVNMNEAHDRYVAEKRVKAEIAKGIAEGLKQKSSAQNVPGQTQSVAMSPAQQVMAKAKAANASTSNDNAMAAAQRLADLVRARENAGVVN